MKPVERGEVLEIAAYEEVREHFRRRIIAEKRVRRVPLGANMSVLFENHDTVLFQIQEMLRTERISAEAAVLHEIETYNELVPGPGELSATIFIEYAEKLERDRMLIELAGVDDDFYVEVAGQRVACRSDPRSVRDDRTLAVHYVKFPLGEALARALVGGARPVVVGVNHPRYSARSELSEESVRSIAADLG
jgi:hypothetical protein